MCAQILDPLFPVLYSFAPFSSPDGLESYATLVQGADGNFYGTNQLGGAHGLGVVYRMTGDGTITPLASFDGANGRNPTAGLTQGADGHLYGTTMYGPSGGGTVFRLEDDGTLTTLASLEQIIQTRVLEADDGNLYGATPGYVFRVATDGTVAIVAHFERNDVYSQGDLIQGLDGALYGTTLYGGTSNLGTVFRVALDGTLTTLVSFDGSNGASPQAGLLQAGDGNYYGTTNSGGSADQGTVFRMAADGTLTTLVHFAGPNGARPAGELIQASDGLLYGTTSGGGSEVNGTVYCLSYDGTLTTLASFEQEPGPDGSAPQGALLQAQDGNFYGTTRDGGIGNGGTVFRMDGNGLLTTLASFSHAWPGSSLVQDADGNFYGTTLYGGTGGQGTVFRTSVNADQQTIASFSGANGAYPRGGVIVASDGNLYGTTERGGTADQGTVFRLTPDGALTTLVSFTGANGRNPMARLTEGADGKLYGTTFGGGANGGGTVFRMAPDGTLATLAPLRGQPRGPVVQGRDGNFYGVNSFGGSANEGTVFRVTPAGVVTELASFDGSNGRNHLAGGGLVQGLDGNFYGTTIQGGASDEGVIYRVTPTGILTTVLNFSASSPLGRYPWAGLVVAADGSLYGTTTEGGAGCGLVHCGGTIFRSDPTGILALPLVAFNGSNGGAAESALMQAVDGDLYGATTRGGENQLGTVYRLDIIPDPFTLLDIPSVDPGAIVTSEPITVAGIEVPVTISVTDGEYSIGCTSEFTTAIGTIADGQTVCVRQVAPVTPGAVSDTQLNVGGVTDTFTTKVASVDVSASIPAAASGGGFGLSTLLPLLLAAARRRRLSPPLKNSPASAA